MVSNRNVWPDRLQSNRLGRDAVPLCFREIGRLINQAVIIRVAIVVKKTIAPPPPSEKKRYASRNQSNNFGVSRKRLKPCIATDSDVWRAQRSSSQRRRLFTPLSSCTTDKISGPERWRKNRGASWTRIAWTVRSTLTSEKMCLEWDAGQAIDVFKSALLLTNHRPVARS